MGQRRRRNGEKDQRGDEKLRQREEERECLLELAGYLYRLVPPWPPALDDTIGC